MALIKVPQTAAELQALQRILAGMQSFIEEADKAIGGEQTKPALTLVPGQAKRRSKPRGKLSPVEGS